MKNIMMLVTFLVPGSVMAGEVGKSLVSCDFGFAKIKFTYISINSENKNLLVYGSQTTQIVSGSEYKLPEIPATVSVARNEVVVSYPMFNTETNETEVNQTITINLRQLSVDGVNYPATMNTMGMKDEGTCRFLD